MSEKRFPSADLSVVVVHYRTPELLTECLRHLRSGLHGLGSETVVVDNSGDAELDAADGAEVVRPGNLGYAGAANLGVRATSGRRIALLNADVLVDASTLPRLLAELEAGWDVVGPRMHQDRSRRLLLPLNEPLGFLWALRRAAFPHRRSTLRRWRRAVRPAWRATAPLATRRLSGALLVFGRSVWRRAGPFDEGFRLYYEEADWLRRVRRAGLRSAHVPAATAVHLYNRSAGAEPRAATWFAQSARRDRRRWHGRLGSRLLEAAARWGSARGRGVREPVQGRPAGTFRGPGWIELAATMDGYPAVAERLDADAELRLEDWRPPADLEPEIRGRGLWLRAQGAEGREHGPFRLTADLQKRSLSAQV